MATFENKSVLVLGGSRGIGAAIVRRFAKDGAKVVFTYSGSPDAARQLATDTGTTAVQTDSADRDAVIARVRDSGPLDIRVVHAGIGVFGDALDLNPDDVDRLLAINVHAPYHASVEAARERRIIGDYGIGLPLRCGKLRGKALDIGLERRRASSQRAQHQRH